MPRLTRLATAVAVLAGALIGLSPGTAAASEESYLLMRANNARAASGLSALSSSSDLNAIAQRHAAAMAASGGIYHNSSLGSQVCCWQAIGENVGMGSNGEQIHNYLMGSAGHRANILSSAYGEIGIGTARDRNGRLYVDQVFRQRMGAGSAPRIRSGSSHSTPATVVARAPRPSPKVILERRLRVAAKDLGHPRDPVAAAYAFADVMEVLTRR